MGQVTEHFAASAFWPGDTTPPTERLHGWIDAGFSGHRSRAAISGGEHINDAGIDASNHIIAEAKPLDGARTHVINKNITLFDDSKCDRVIGFMLEVEFDHALVVVSRYVEHRIAIDPRRHGV